MAEISFGESEKDMDIFVYFSEDAQLILAGCAIISTDFETVMSWLLKEDKRWLKKI